jgi:hypothetical protein
MMMSDPPFIDMYIYIYILIYIYIYDVRSIYIYTYMNIQISLYMHILVYRYMSMIDIWVWMYAIWICYINLNEYCINSKGSREDDVRSSL